MANWFCGVATGDVDGDGDPDLYFATYDAIGVDDPETPDVGSMKATKATSPSYSNRASSRSSWSGSLMSSSKTTPTTVPSGPL